MFKKCQWHRQIMIYNKVSNGENIDALIGCTGFVGGTLLRQRAFQYRFHSANIRQGRSRTYGDIVCCAAPAQKWLANKQPLVDLQNIESLIDNLRTMSCNRFVLISTVDVFKQPVRVDESVLPVEGGLHPYGLHRRLLEKFVASHFKNSLIIRLPGLVGPDLRKNVIFDLLNDNAVSSIDHRGLFQFYPMVNLWRDVETALNARVDLLHLMSEPVTVAQIAEECFDINFQNTLDAAASQYDVQSIHASLYGSSSNYQYSGRETFLAIRSYIQSSKFNEGLKIQ